MGQNNTLNKKDQIIIGIDFGSCGITYAYGFLDQPKREPFLGQFPGQNKNCKVSTEIILDDKLEKVLSFGNECNTFLSTVQDEKFHHFKNIKMNLYKRDYKIKAKNSNKIVDADYIIAKILEEVKKEAIKQIKYSIKNLNKNNIHWVITVPAIWDVKSKQVMINAAQKAGLIRDDDDPSNFFALEPEAASIYYHNSPQGMKNEDIDSGKPFILCDLGSGTADIVTQKKVVRDKEIKFEELYPPIGGDCGCNQININFMERVIKKLFGKECFEETEKNVSENNYYDWFEFENRIEEFKKNYKKIDQKDKKFRIDCEIFKNYCKEDLEKLINNFNSNNESWELKIETGWKILFPYRIINDLMQELINKIKKEYLSQIMESINKIETLVFTGGASASPILFDMIKNCKDLNIKNHVASVNPEVAIAFGSVLYSFDHYIISPRKSKYTFGIKTSDIWDNKRHIKGGIKIYDKLDKIYRCKNSFTRFIQKNENLRPFDEISHKFTMNNSKANVQLYKTEKDNATFCDEDGVTLFGEFIIDVENHKFDKSNKVVEVKMKMGGTFISASAIYCKTGDKFKLTCLYE